MAAAEQRTNQWNYGTWVWRYAVLQVQRPTCLSVHMNSN
jgi:hypothetical protein